ncbi:MAG TPA: hypothetical protein VI790_02605 [Candidatus Nanoarchaeia archaeon]|nr:hypothetical protein [Candidatus Nanoarchaeia archaeon]
MRLDFFKSLLEQGYTECLYCGKVISKSNEINGSCPDCASKKRR